MRSHEIDMVHGPLFPKLIRFAIPLMISGILQLLFNAIDMVVVGRFSGNEALAAIGSTSALVYTMTNLFTGLALGTNIEAAKDCGAGDDASLHRTVHTSIALALVCGVLMVFVGIFSVRPCLIMMNTPDDVLDMSAIYLQIYFAGMPFFMLYNFGAAVLRAIGDTKRPLFYLLISGVLNAVLNVFLVVTFELGVVGVGIATVVSQAFSAVMVMKCLLTDAAPYRLEWKKIRFHANKLKRILFLGIPAGLQGVVIDFSNIVVQASLNSFGSVVMAGNAAATNLDSFLWTASSAFAQACLSFVGQNVGAKNYRRVDLVVLECSLLVVATCLILPLTLYFNGEAFLHIYSSDPEVVANGMVKFSVILIPYMFCGLMDMIPNATRGMGMSIAPTVISLTLICGLRILWILTVFAHWHDLRVLYISYPLTWILTTIAQVICFFAARKKMRQMDWSNSRTVS